MVELILRFFCHACHVYLFSHVFVNLFEIKVTYKHALFSMPIGTSRTSLIPNVTNAVITDSYSHQIGSRRYWMNSGVGEVEVMGWDIR